VRIFDTPFVLKNGVALPITISIGVAVSRHRDDKADNLLERADRALYVAKHEGRNRVVLANDSAAGAGAPAADRTGQIRATR